MEDWAELDGLVAELEAANAEWSKSIGALRTQVEAFREVGDAAAKNYQDLRVEDALLAVAQRALGDTARLQTARLNFGLTRSAVLLWSAIDDPRPALSTATPEAHCSIEVRIGPRYMLGIERDRGGAGDQRLAIMIAGAKQLVATLPTTPEKFRSALLIVFKDPHISDPTRDGAESNAPPAEPPETATAEPEESAEVGDAAAAASSQATATGASGEQSDVAPPAGEDDEALTAADSKPNVAAGTASEESVIQLPGSTD
jgi:hypothetical protein